jgi:hypothetical protein
MRGVLARCSHSGAHMPDLRVSVQVRRCEGPRQHSSGAHWYVCMAHSNRHTDSAHGWRGGKCSQSGRRDAPTWQASPAEGVGAGCKLHRLAQPRRKLSCSARLVYFARVEAAAQVLASGLCSAAAALAHRGMGCNAAASHPFFRASVQAVAQRQRHTSDTQAAPRGTHALYNFYTRLRRLRKRPYTCRRAAKQARALHHCTAGLHRVLPARLRMVLWHSTPLLNHTALA